MQDGQRHRKVAELIDDFDGLRTKCERIGDRMRGFAVLFGAVAALVAAAGIWGHAPIFAVSAGFSLSAALAFALTAHALAAASRAAPRVRRAYAPTARVEPLRKAA
jgi:hypothetical protein